MPQRAQTGNRAVAQVAGHEASIPLLFALGRPLWHGIEGCGPDHAKQAPAVPCRRANPLADSELRLASRQRDTG